MKKWLFFKKRVFNCVTGKTGKKRPKSFLPPGRSPFFKKFFSTSYFLRNVLITCTIDFRKLGSPIQLQPVIRNTRKKGKTYGKIFSTGKVAFFSNFFILINQLGSAQMVLKLAQFVRDYNVKPEKMLPYVAKPDDPRNCTRNFFY